MNRDQGFTLLEVLVALTLFGLMLGMVFTVLSLGTRTWETAEPRAEALNGRLVLERFLRRRLAAALTWPDGRDEPPLLGRSDELEFIAFPPLVIGLRGPQRFRLYRDGQQLRVRVLTLEGELPETERESRDLLLLEPVGQVRFRYFGTEGWQDTWEERRLPLLVEVSVTGWPPVVARIRAAQVRQERAGFGFGGRGRP